MFVSRRTLLVTGAASAAIAALGVREAILPPPAEGRWALSEPELGTVTALGEAMFPPGNPLGVSGPEVDLAARVDHLLGQELDAEIGEIFRYLLRALEDGTLVSRGHRFAALPLEERQSVIAHWDDNDLLPRRALYDGLRLVMGMAYFNAPEVTASIGWRSRCHLGST